VVRLADAGRTRACVRAWANLCRRLVAAGYHRGPKGSQNPLMTSRLMPVCTTVSKQKGRSRKDPCSLSRPVEIELAKRRAVASTLEAVIYYGARIGHPAYLRH